MALVPDWAELMMARRAEDRGHESSTFATSIKPSALMRSSMDRVETPGHRPPGIGLPLAGVEIAIIYGLDAAQSHASPCEVSPQRCPAIGTASGKTLALNRSRRYGLAHGIHMVAVNHPDVIFSPIFALAQNGNGSHEQ
jgi:hypothetical protein